MPTWQYLLTKTSKMTKVGGHAVLSVTKMQLLGTYSVYLLG